MSRKKAFTIIELMLAMAFLGTMLVGIASLIMRITSIYQKGLALRGVNSIGREIVSDLTRTIGGSKVNVDINPEIENGEIKVKNINKARAQYFVETSHNDNDNQGNRQSGGVFCTGDYSYVWNTADNLRIARSTDGLSGKTFKDDASAENANSKGIYVIKTESEYYIPKFARFTDKDRSACASEDEDNDGSYLPQKQGAGMKAKWQFIFDLGDSSTPNDIVELIQDNESDLAIYNFSILPATQHNGTKQIFYSGTFILATYRGGVNIKANGDYCQGSSREDGGRENDNEVTLSDFDYCAVNKFNFSARATGEAGINKYGD